ncbi:MAG: HdeA/HdeB family chaperone [Parasphingorhabdus sp.]|uniref:HdeA/HdeB family chaperone n=1 Tax=Parasphingorhabdus sp. TaxID=2709688 RepID=UPI0030039CB6
MFYFTNFHKSMAAAIAASALFISPLQAQEETEEANPYGLSSAESVDLKALTCWDVVTLAEEDRAFTMTMLYGYVMGTQGKSEIKPRDIQVAIVTTMTKCVDTPDAKVLDVLKEQMSH